MRPIAIATWSFGEPAVAAAFRKMEEGAPALDAVVAGINVAELDPAVSSVGYGGFPNADGEVEVDAAIMDGPGRRAGSVASLRHIRTPISVARRLMDVSPHVMLVGEGARRFAREQGFVEETMDTEASRRAYQEWIASGRPPRWLGGPDLPDASMPLSTNAPRAQSPRQLSPPELGVGGQRQLPPNLPASHDTIGLAALDREGRLAVGCSTSGVAFKAPGRVGDSPIIGAGLYVDQNAGAASATGVGEVILRFCLSHQIVEGMRAGLSAQEACEQAILRVLEADPRYTALQIGVIALGADGSTGAASTRPERSPLAYAVASPDGVHVLDARQFP